MRIVFYSTNTNQFDNNLFRINTCPSTYEIFKNFVKSHPEDEFFVVTQQPCFFMPDKGENVIILPEENDYNEVAFSILRLHPDIAIAMSFWVDPYDWLTVSDSLVGECLKSCNVKTICHSVETGLTCFDKRLTEEKLKALGFYVPKSVYVDHDLYFCAGSNKKVIHNVYKDAVANQIKKLTLPLVIKDTVGVSSYGTTVVNTYGEAIDYLNSKRNNSNRIVEEYMCGVQMGTEIYGVPGNYSVLEPIMISLNHYGITSPKVSAKYGPVYEGEKLPEVISLPSGIVIKSQKYDFSGLKEMLLKLAEAMEFKGAAQVDLIFSEGKWYIIEINPRLSGMSYTYSSLLGLSLFEIMYKTCIACEKIALENGKKVLNIKLPVMELGQCRDIYQMTDVDFVHLTDNEDAKQEREKGYTEIILTGKGISEIKKTLAELKGKLPECDFSKVENFIGSMY